MPLNHSRHSGFTLIELLVVVVIISISIGLVVVNFTAPNDQEIVDEEINRLQQILRFAHQQSVIRGEEYGVRFYQTGYRFMHYDEDNNAWIDITKDKLLRYRLLPSPLEFELYIEQIPVELLESADNDPKPTKTDIETQEDDSPATINASNLNSTQTNSQSVKPQIFLLSSSELTPQFELQLRIPGSDIEANLNGLPEGKYTRSHTDE